MYFITKNVNNKDTGKLINNKLINLAILYKREGGTKEKIIKKD